MSQARGAALKSLSTAFLADLEEDCRHHGKEIFPILREKYPQAYFQHQGACRLQRLPHLFILHIHSKTIHGFHLQYWHLIVLRRCDEDSCHGRDRIYRGRRRTKVVAATP
jgi:hypothetical protein